MPIGVWIIAFAVSIIGLVLASVSDLRERIVDDKISYGLIVTGLILFAINGLVLQDWLGLGWAVLAGIATFLGGYWLWRIGFWAGGDVKLFTGLAVLNPINWVAIPKLLGLASAFPVIEWPVFSLSLFMGSVLAMFPVGVVFALAKIWKEPKKIKLLFFKVKKQLKSIGLFALFVVGLETLVHSFSVNGIVLLVLIVLFGFAPFKIKLVAGSLLGAIGIGLAGINGIVNMLLVFVLLTAGSFFLGIFFSLSKLFRTKKKVDALEEGDIPAVSIVETPTGFEVHEDKGLVESLKNLKKQGLVKAKKTVRVVCSNKRAGGLEKEQIQELQALARQQKIPKELEVKESTAFVPAVLLAYVFLNAVGNPLWLLF